MSFKILIITVMMMPNLSPGLIFWHQIQTVVSLFYSKSSQKLLPICPERWRTTPKAGFPQREHFQKITPIDTFWVFFLFDLNNINAENKQGIDDGPIKFQQQVEQDGNLCKKLPRLRFSEYFLKKKYFWKKTV